MSITAANSFASGAGSVPQQVWNIATQPSTVVTSGLGAGSAIFNVSESTSGNTAIYGIYFTDSAPGPQSIVNLHYTPGGEPILVHDCFFVSTQNLDCIYSNTNRGVIWNCFFEAQPFSMRQLAVHMKNCPVASWTTADTMGMADATGENNLYVENCEFDGWLNATDFDDCSRSVTRYCTFNNAGWGTHGADTSNFGVRHYEYYQNNCVYDGFSNGQSLNLNWWLYLRGGTGVITGNVMPHLSSGDYGSKTDINMTVMNLQRDAGPNPGWGVLGASLRRAGWNYPAPRQVGFGLLTGAATFPSWSSGDIYPGPGAFWAGDLVTYMGSTYQSELANSSTSDPAANPTDWTNTGYAPGNDSITYIGDSDPLYIWGNTPTGAAAASASTTDYGIGEADSIPSGSNPDSSAAYVVQNRDFYFDSTGTASGAKPGYTEYSYPHPLRGNSAPAPTPTPTPTPPPTPTPTPVKITPNINAEP